MSLHHAHCQDCEWNETLPRENVEHAKRVHEDETGHMVVLEDPEQS